MGIESRHLFVPVAALYAPRLAERDPEALFLSPNYRA